MTVPGPFFDVNPGGVRTGPSPYASWMRFSFGPPEVNVRMGLDRLAKMIAEDVTTNRAWHTTDWRCWQSPVGTYPQCGRGFSGWRQSWTRFLRKPYEV